MVVMCIVLLILAMMMIGGRNVHPIWDRRRWRMVHFSNFWVVAMVGNLLLQ